MEWFRTSTTLDWKNMLQKRIPSFPGQSVNLWFVFFLKFPWNSPKLQLPPPPPKKHYFKLQTPPHPLYPPTLAPTIQELFYKKHGTMYQDLMSQIATGHQLKPRRIPQHSFDCLAMLLDESLVIWVCLKLKESPQQLIQAFLSLSGHLYIQSFIFWGEVILYILLPDALYEAFICKSEIYEYIHSFKPNTNYNDITGKKCACKKHLKHLKNIPSLWGVDGIVLKGFTLC